MIPAPTFELSAADRAEATARALAAVWVLSPPSWVEMREVA